MSTANVESHSRCCVGVTRTVTTVGAAHQSHEWYQAYLAALFERDRERMVEKLRQAERLIVLREREMFGQQSSAPERGALHRAFHAIRELQLCQKLPHSNSMQAA